MPGTNSTNAERSTRRPRYHPLVLVLAAAASGIVLDRFLPLDFFLWFVPAIIALLVWLALLRRRKEVPASFALLIAIASTAAFWHHGWWNCYSDADLGNFVSASDEPIVLEAIALGSPRAMPVSPPDPMRTRKPEPAFRFEIQAVKLRDGETWRPVVGRALLTIQGDPPNVEAGDRLKIFGRIAAPAKLRNPGDFDYAGYLRGQRIRAVIQAKNAACVSKLESGDWRNLSRGLDRLRVSGTEMFRRHLDPSQADLASAVLLGEREHVDRGQTAAYMSTGTIHVLSISGLHVGVLAGALIWLRRFLPLPRVFGAAIVAAATGLYSLMVDSNPPVIRATILVLIACGALWLYRRKLGYNSLAAAGLVVLAINPSDLFNVGAQLSFLSVAVLIYFGSRWGEGDERDALERLAEKNLSFFSTKWRHWKAFFKELTLFGIAIWLVTTPLVMARFHLFSPVALVMNILLWIPMTLGLLSGFAILAAGAVCPPLAHLCGNFCNANLWLLDKSVRFADAAPGTHYWVAGPNDWWLAVFYAGLAVAACFPQVRPSRRWCAALALLWISVGIAASFAGKSHHSLQCTFVSVEHGAAAILELPSGQTVLCDAGQMASPYRGAQSIAAVLWSRGITHLDAVVLSHADIDHFDALPELLEKFSVGAVYVSPSMFENPSATLRSLKEAIEKKKIPCREIYKGCLLEGGQNCRIETLHPARQRTQYDHNAESVVLAVEYRGFRLLLPGDIEAEGMNALLAQPSQPCTVLLAPHHGSPRNNTPEFAAWCRPRWVVLSGDGQWNTPEIQAIYRAVNGKILDTHSDGAITFHFDASGVRVETFLKNQ